MKRHFIYSLAATFITAALTLGSLTACSNEDLVSNTNNTQAKTYTVSIPASMGEDGTTRAVDFSGTDLMSGKPTAVSSFKTTDKIYVYNQSKTTMLTGHLTPSANGKTCDLTGSLTGNIKAGDNLVLLYNLSVYDSSDPIGCYFDFAHQNGTQAGVTDGATATVTASVENYDLTTATAHFQNVQSMFRFQFTSNGTPVNVKTVDIYSQKDAIANAYYPCVNAVNYVCAGAFATLPSATTEPIYVALCIDESQSANDVLIFEVVDADNKLYRTTKAAPTTPTNGFVNGKYYYNSNPIDLGASVLQLVKPTLSRSDGGNDSELTDAVTYRCFYIKSPSKSGAGAAQGITMSMSGTSTGYWFVLDGDNSNTVNISGITATFDKSADYIDSYNSLTLNISGDNTITCKNFDYCVSADGNLKLSGNGTLTVTAKSITDYGLDADNYDGWGDTYDPSALAAPGYTVTRSATQNNGDGAYSWTYTVAPDPGKPLTLKAIQAGSVTVSSYGVPNLTHDITYKINGGATQTVNRGTAISLNADDEISFYSTNAALATSGSDYIRIIPAMPCYVYGNVMSLIDDSGNGFATDKTISSDYALCKLFILASNLRNHPSLPLLLPATTLTTGCYYNMFFGCSGLTTAPSLPAETMATSCYSGMFTGCTSLTAAPSLPAESLAERCYESMFNGCTSLTAAPELKATTLANNCYNNMFLGCTSLTVAPELKATTLAEYCYCGMFQSCTNLSVAPELKATTLANYCCSNMFRYCTNLTVAPELKAATLVNNCYSNMFYGCTNLTVAPELKATTLVNSCYNSMFYGCTKLANVKCLATSGLNDGNCTLWLHGVAASGTFTKSSYYANWHPGESGIPTGWTVQEE